MNRFTEEQWKEIYAVRGRLEAIRSKIQHGYPELPEEPIALPPEPEWTQKQGDTVQQLKSEVVGWRQKHALALLEIDSLKALLSRKRYVY